MHGSTDIRRGAAVVGRVDAAVVRDRADAVRGREVVDALSSLMRGSEGLGRVVHSRRRSVPSSSVLSRRGGVCPIRNSGGRRERLMRNVRDKIGK